MAFPPKVVPVMCKTRPGRSSAVELAVKRVRLALLLALPDQRRGLVLRGPSSLVRRPGSRRGVSIDRPELERCVVDVDLPMESSVSQETRQLFVDQLHPPPARARVGRLASDMV